MPGSGLGMQSGWIRRWWREAVLALLLAGIAAALAGRIAEQRALSRFEAAVRVDARLREALLTSEVARFRLLPLALAADRDLDGALAGSAPARRALNQRLETLASTTGAAAIYVIGADGRAIAASNWRTAHSFVGMDYRFRRYFREATLDALATQFAMGTVSHKPGLYLSRRTARGGVIVVKLEFDQVERQWRGAGGITFADDDHGVILVTSRPDWRFRVTRPLGPLAAARFRAEIQSGEESLALLPWAAAARAAGDARVTVPGQADRLLWVRLPPSPSGWRLNLLRSTTTAVDDVVRLAAFGAALAMLALYGTMLALRARSRRLAARTHELEAAVATRTAELRREIDERIASDARADLLREGLRQANRLATLGQVTASVAHETAQPVAAIRTYAVNGERLLERGDAEQVRGNLQAIGRLAGRIGEVTAALRGFARKGTGAIGPMPLAEAVDGARLILKERLSSVAFTAALIPPDLLVLAGKVRLEQVLVNLLQNAIEALEGRYEPRLALTLEMDDETVRVEIADNGPGVDQAIAARIFTPFVTSRAAGLGLGLVIALDLMTDMGGTLRLLPSTQGACFQIELKRAG